MLLARLVSDRNAALPVFFGLLVILVGVPGMVLGAFAPQVPSDTNVSAVVAEIWTSFPRAQGPGDVVLNAPHDMCMDSKGRMFILDRWDTVKPGRIYVLNQEVKVEAVIGSTEDVTVKIPEFGHDLTDIAVDSKDRIYVCDATIRHEYPGGLLLPGRVHVLHSNLSWLGSIEIPYGDAAGSPYCIAIDSKDRLVVGQWRGLGASRILVFAPNQTGVNDVSMVLERVVQPCPLGEDCPTNRHGLPMDISVDQQGRVIITETLDYGTQYFPYLERVVVLDQDYRWVMSLGSYGKEPGHFIQLTSAVVDPSGVIVAADAGTRTISFFFPNGTFAGRIGKQGSEPGEFSLLGRMIVTEKGKIMLADWGNKIVQSIVVDLSTLRPVAVVPENAALVGLFLALATRLICTSRKTTTSLQSGRRLPTLPLGYASTDRDQVG